MMEYGGGAGTAGAGSAAYGTGSAGGGYTYQFSQKDWMEYRQRALELAIGHGGSISDVMTNAKIFESFIVRGATPINHEKEKTCKCNC